MRGVEEGPEAAGFFNKNGVGINYTFVALIFPRPGWKGVLNTVWAAHDAAIETWPGRRATGSKRLAPQRSRRR